MSFYYKDTEQISQFEMDNIYKHVNPKYPKSTTDPTYYEPNATRIANMKKSAVSSQLLYDFKSGDKMPELDKIHTVVGRKPGFTNEEMSQIETLNTKILKDEVESLSKDKKERQKAKDERIAEAKETVNAINETKGSMTYVE